jgi:hypothetical protein
MLGTLLMTAGAWLLGDLVVGMMIGRVLRGSSQPPYVPHDFIPR